MGLSQAHVSKLASLRRRVEEMYAILVVEVDRFGKAANSGAIPDERDVADGAYLCKLMSEKLDDARKECNTAQQAASQWACEQHTLKQLSGSAENDTIYAQLCTAKTKVKMIPAVPKKGTPEYEALCADLGLPQELYEANAFHAHWPGLVDLCSRRLQEGLALPAGIDKYTVKTENGLELLEVTESDLAFRKAV